MCVHVFATGYSSGSWLVNTLDCTRGDKPRATGTVSGGVAISTAGCKGEYARIVIHDLNDTTNKFVENGNKAELDRLGQGQSLPGDCAGTGGPGAVRALPGL